MADDYELKGVEVLRVEIAKLTLAPTDILVLKLKGKMTREKREQGGKFLQQLIRDMKVRSAILDDDAELQAVEAPTLKEAVYRARKMLADGEATPLVLDTFLRDLVRE